MLSASEDLKDILEGDGVGTFASEAANVWSIRVSLMPTSPNRCIVIYDSGGAPPNPKFLLDEPTVNIRIRGNKLDYKATYAKALSVRDALLGRSPVTVNTTRYIGFFAASDVAFIGYDDNQRPLFSLNIRMYREPSSGTHRSAL